jgi:hypothetical protein
MPPTASTAATWAKTLCVSRGHEFNSARHSARAGDPPLPSFKKLSAMPSEHRQRLRIFDANRLVVNTI